LNRPTRRGFASSRRRAPVTFGAYGFLRPPRRHEEEQQRFIERLREEPLLRREYRASLGVQMAVVGALLLACIGLVVQSALMVRSMRSPAVASMGWLIPCTVGLLTLLVFRRFMRLVSDFRHLDPRHSESDDTPSDATH
jgi:hypothetical protein